MLSSSCSHRLLSLLNQALLSCKEEEKQLEEHLRQSRALLTDWNTDTSETLKQDDKSSEPQESQPSLEELQEVEQLNKVLQKALIVRRKSGTQSANVITTPSTQTAPPCLPKEKPSKHFNNRPLHTGPKPATYKLNPPYKTVPNKTTVRGSGRRPSNDKSARLTPVEQPAPGKDTGGKDRQSETKGSSTRTGSMLLKPGSPSSTVPDEETTRHPKAFTLKDKGATLKLPPEYRQAYMRNSRLWEKFYEIQDHVPASRPSFIQRLQTTFMPESPELSLFEIEEETARLQRAMRSLQENVEAANNWQGSVSKGPVRWQNYQSLLLLEVLQEEVAKYHTELQKLQLVAEQYKKWAEKHSINIACTEAVDCPRTIRRSPPVLVYSHYRELCELTRSRLRVLELQQKIYLQKVLSEELLAEAESQCQGSSTPCTLLRAIYTQLCDGGNSFPVLVQDDG